MTDQPTPPPLPRFMLAWFEKDPAQARLILQLTLNSLMIAGVLVLHASPWLTLAWLLVLFALACVLHGSGAWQLLGIFGILGWVGEAWLVGFGAVWAFQIPAQSLMQGGLFGVPFYMAPAWALVGALMLVLDGVFRPRARSG